MTSAHPHTGQADAAHLSSTGIDLLDAAVHLDVGAVTDTVTAAIASHGALWAWEQLIRPVWTCFVDDTTPMLVVTERLFSRTVSQVLAGARRSRDGAPAQILLACTDEEHHTLPLDVVATSLAEAGVGSCALGARVPPQALAAAARRVRPAVVIIWSQTPGTGGPHQVTTRLAALRGPVMIAAGPGWSPILAAGITATVAGVSGVVTLTRAVLSTTRAPV